MDPRKNREAGRGFDDGSLYQINLFLKTKSMNLVLQYPIEIGQEAGLVISNALSRITPTLSGQSCS